MDPRDALSHAHRAKMVTSVTSWPKSLKLSILLHRFQPNFAQHRRPQSVHRGWSKYVPKNPRWWTAAILKKNVKSPYLRNRFLTDFDEIWHGDEYWSPTTGDRPLKFRIFENSRWRWPPSWKSQQSRYLSNGLVDQSRPLQSIVNVFRPKKVTSSYYTKRPTLSNTNPTVDVPLQFFLSPELEKKSTV